LQRSIGLGALRPLRALLPLASGALAALSALLAPSLTETAVANGDTRTIHLYHAHTQESIDATYMVNGQYDSSVLQKLNWFLRDWRRDEPTNMDPRLFDVIWEAYHSAGAGDEIVKVVSAYRSPETNAMLRSRSRAVAKYSQHMLGKAMDTTMPGMPMSRIREIGMKMQRGGVGYYPTAGTPFVHLDVGSVRAWPRMTYDQLARLFPDGKTVHIPSNNQPLARYEEARAEIEARNNGAIVVGPRRTFGGLLAFFFGGGGGEDEAEDAAPQVQPDRKKWAKLAPRMGKEGKKFGSESDEEGGGEPAPQTRVVARAEANLPRGETAMSAPAQEEAAPAPQEKTPAARRAPQPPARPAALDVPAPPERPTPIETAREDDSRAGRAATEPAEAPASAPPARAVASAAPLPPRRPAALLAAAKSTPAQIASPLPPSRPKQLAGATPGGAATALTTLIDPKGGGDAKQTRGKKRGPDALAYAPGGGERPKPPQAPATAAAAQPHAPAAQQGASAPGFAPARLDGSNFLTMTGATPAARAPAASVLGASVGNMRSAARSAAQGDGSTGGGPQPPADVEKR
jgi:uncharacterized protein YcbK (DUF882 family)